MAKGKKVGKKWAQLTMIQYDPGSTSEPVFESLSDSLTCLRSPLVVARL